MGSIRPLFVTVAASEEHQSITSSAHDTSPVTGSQQTHWWVLKKKAQCDQIRCAYRKRQLMARWHQIRLTPLTSKQPLLYWINMSNHILLTHFTYLCFGDLNVDIRSDMPKKAPKKSLNHGRLSSIPSRPRLHRPFIGIQAGSERSRAGAQRRCLSVLQPRVKEKASCAEKQRPLFITES